MADADSVIDIGWACTTAAEAPAGQRALATMTGHAFQTLITGDDLHASVRAVGSALRPEGHFAFETTNPALSPWIR